MPMECTEKEIRDTMADLGCTEEEAIECLTIEKNMVKPKNHTVANPTKEKKQREIKIDEEKVDIINNLFSMLEYDNKNIANPQKEITFTIGDNNYSISLIKHRPKKN